MYALLPAAGYGTRFLPWTKSVPKEMLPIHDRPVIHYVVEEAYAAGIRDVVIILSEGKEAIRNYFTPQPKLEAHLREQGTENLLASLNTLIQHIRFHFVYQPEMRGLGDAVRCGLEAVPADEAFAVLLPDTIIQGLSPLPAMCADLRCSGRGSVAVQPVPPERATRYGVCGGHEIAPGEFELDCMVEKPPLEAIPRLIRLDGSQSPMAFAARYVFPPSLRTHLDHTRPGRLNEIQLTDAMAALLHAEGFHAHHLQGTRLDIGTPEGLLHALTTL